MSSPETLVSMMRKVSEQPDGGLVVVRAKSEARKSYRELFGSVGAVAANLIGAGVKPGDRVIVILPQGFDLVEAFLACLAFGAVPSILAPVSAKQDPSLYWRDIGLLLERIQARAVITFADYVEQARPLLLASPARILTFSELSDGGPQPVPWREPNPQDIAFLQHSSGTTAVKKGVMISHAAAVAQLRAYGEALGVRPQDTVASWLPLYHDMGLVACFLLPVMLGLDLVLLDPFEWTMQPALLFEAAQAHGASLVWLPNFAFQHLTGLVKPSRRFDLSGVRAFISCSEPARADTLDRFAERFAQDGVTREALQVCYAMAETVFAVTQTPLGRPVRILDLAQPDFGPGEPVVLAQAGQAAARLPSCGRPVAGMSIRILGRDSEPVGEGVSGQIAVQAPYVFSGYYELPDASRDAFAGGWFLTGDLGFLKDGELFVTGRLKDVLIINGRNIMAHDVEAAVHGVPGLKAGRAVALGVYDSAAASDQLVIVAELDGQASAAEMKAEVKRQVSRRLGLTLARVYAAPSGWIVKSTSGKLNRKANLEKILQTDHGATLT